MEAEASKLYKEKVIRGFCHLYTGQVMLKRVVSRISNFISALVICHQLLVSYPVSVVNIFIITMILIFESLKVCNLGFTMQFRDNSHVILMITRLFLCIIFQYIFLLPNRKHVVWV